MIRSKGGSKGSRRRPTSNTSEATRGRKPVVVITIGDPSGVGPEVTLKALASPEVEGLANFYIVGDRFVIDKVCRDMRFDTPRAEIIDCGIVSPRKFYYGVCDPYFGRAAVSYIDRALVLLNSGKADALVTAPVNKEAIVMSGIGNFSGHTEYLAEKTGTTMCVMMFAGGDMKVGLVTRHIALADVPSRLTVGLVADTILMVHQFLKKNFRIRSPKIAVAGLNPHAGEGGKFGDEEARIIAPAIEKVRLITGGHIAGPIPSDTLFTESMREKFDVIIAQYHDQGLIPFKMLHFHDGVNMTIGLPFVRTSPDHGTAFDRAGKGIANPRSMIEAIRLACRLSVRPHQAR